ncbi:cytochrome c maturation protein CcmE [Hyphobacterium sp.]|uniref:cytochrome c maturation protein CcmE n=1 Tax=Hyphobacterium sp. TaxID=2004662 RepID=UPI003749FAD1
MRARSQRLIMVAVAGVILIAAIGLALVALRDAIVLFYSPSEVAADHPGIGERIRIGGLVEEGSVERPAEGGANFVVTDGAATIRVTYSGSLPDLFREGQGVVAEGAFEPSGDFAASSVLAKHDETYMPPEVAEALRDSGVWQGEDEK